MYPHRTSNNIIPMVPSYLPVRDIVHTLIWNPRSMPSSDGFIPGGHPNPIQQKADNPHATFNYNHPDYKTGLIV